MIKPESTRLYTHRMFPCAARAGSPLLPPSLPLTAADLREERGAHMPDDHHLSWARAHPQARERKTQRNQGRYEKYMK